MTMMIMPANNTGAWVGYLAGRYEGALGHLYSPGAERGPFPFLPYALDNGAYGAFLNGKPFDVAAWRALLGWAQSCGQRPMWSLVPDVVGDKAGTIAAWHQYAHEVIASGFKPAFAVQDGMMPDDVPDEAKVIFIGGSTEWKWSTAHMWCAAFPHVHIGRVNTLRWLRAAANHGAKSVDGTGWFRGDKNQREGLRHFLAEQAGEIPSMAQQNLFTALSDMSPNPVADVAPASGAHVQRAVGPALVLLSVLLAGAPGRVFAGADQLNAFGAGAAAGHVVGVALVGPVTGAGGLAGRADAAEQDRLAGVRAVLVADHTALVIGSTAAADRHRLAVNHCRGVGGARVAAEDTGDVQAGGAPTGLAVGGAGLGLLGGLDRAEGDGGGVLLGHWRLLAGSLRWCCEGECSLPLGLSTAYFNQGNRLPNPEVSGPPSGGSTAPRC